MEQEIFWVQFRKGVQPDFSPLIPRILSKILLLHTSDVLGDEHTVTALGNQKQFWKFWKDWKKAAWTPI